MITIIFTNVYEHDSHVEDMGDDNELKFLLDCEMNNKTIYVHYHKYSLTREYFIEPNLECGYLSPDVLGVMFHTEIKGIHFNYKIYREVEVNPIPQVIPDYTPPIKGNFDK